MIHKYYNIKNLLTFEIISWYGRNLKKGSKTKISMRNGPILLDLGVGRNYTKNWINADFFLLPRFKFWKKYSQRHKRDLELDLRYPIKCEDNFVDGIYSGHTLEHLFYNEASFLLKEIFRILRPSCWLRINVPDLERIINFYNGAKIDSLELQFETGAEAISDLCQNWGHRSVWDEKVLKKKLEMVGFINVKKVIYGKEGHDKRLIKEEQAREEATLIMEAQKP